MTSSQSSVPASVEVLREAAELLDVREIARRTAKRMGYSTSYCDVHAVLTLAAERGEVEILRRSLDLRSGVWQAVIT